MRIIEYLNLSNNKNLDADSGYRLFKDKVKYTLTKRSDFHFYYLSPYEHYDKITADMRQYKSNVTVLPIQMLSANNGSRFFLDIKNIEMHIQPNKRDYDILSVQEPSVVGSLNEVFNGFNHFNPPIFSYVHWICEDVGIKRNLHERFSYISGIYLSDIAGCNSKYGKKLILEQATNLFSENVIKEIDNKLRVIQPAIDSRAIEQYKVDKTKNEVKRLIFNHRLNGYTGYRFIITELEKLWAKRHDFEIVFTNPSKMSLKDQELMSKKSWLRFVDLNREGYLKELWNSDICFAAHEGSNQWSLALIEAVGCGCIPLAGTKAFQKEILDFCFGEEFFYADVKQFLPKLEHILDNIDEYKTKVLDKRVEFIKRWSWENIINVYLNIYEEMIDNAAKVDADCESMKKIRDIITTRKTISKKSLIEDCLKWSDFIEWTKYRRRILEEFEDNEENRDTYYCVKGYQPDMQQELF